MLLLKLFPYLIEFKILRNVQIGGNFIAIVSCLPTVSRE